MRALGVPRSRRAAVHALRRAERVARTVWAHFAEPAMALGSLLLALSGALVLPIGSSAAVEQPNLTFLAASGAESQPQTLTFDIEELRYYVAAAQRRALQGADCVVDRDWRSDEGVTCLQATCAMSGAEAACCLVGCRGGGNTQPTSLTIPALQSHACPLDTLEAQIAAVNEQCCVFAGPSGSRCPAVSCTVECAVVLLPTLHSCRPILDLLFDNLDGTRDGSASVLDTVYQSCMEIGTEDALEALSDLRLYGTCTETDFNGVGLTEVAAAPCADARQSCPAGIAAGFVSCADDFCPTTTCMLAGQCDRTCGCDAHNIFNHARSRCVSSMAL